MTDRWWSQHNNPPSRDRHWSDYLGRFPVTEKVSQGVAIDYRITEEGEVRLVEGGSEHRRIGE